jgi:class 3 adenylate cyclase
MTPVRVERRLAAIVAADIVGYSHLIEMDEAKTLAAIRTLRREVIDPLLAEHKGRLVSSWLTARWSSSAPLSTR